jgi:hypothetical protein
VNLKIAYRILYFSILIVGSGRSFSQDIGLESVAPLIGVGYTAENEKVGLLAGISANFGELSDNLEVYPSLIYRFTDEDGQIQLAIDTKYFFTPHSGFYAGAGFSVNRYKSGSDANAIYPGFAVLTGTEQFIGNTIWFIQIKFDVTENFKMIRLSSGFFFDIYR